MHRLMGRKPDLEGASVRVWLLEPSTVFDEVYGTESMTAAVATFLTTQMEQALQRRFVTRGVKVRFVHDWRACATYEAQARQLLLDWGRASRAHTEQVTICLSASASPFFRIAAGSAVAVLRIAGMQIGLADDFAPLSEQLRQLALAEAFAHRTAPPPAARPPS